MVSPFTRIGKLNAEKFLESVYFSMKAAILDKNQNHFGEFWYFSSEGEKFENYRKYDFSQKYQFVARLSLN